MTALPVLLSEDNFEQWVLAVMEAFGLARSTEVRGEVNLGKLEVPTRQATTKAKLEVET